MFSRTETKSSSPEEALAVMPKREEIFRLIPNRANAFMEKLFQAEVLVSSGDISACTAALEEAADILCSACREKINTWNSSFSDRSFIRCNNLPPQKDQPMRHGFDATLAAALGLMPDSAKELILSFDTKAGATTCYERIGEIKPDQITPDLDLSYKLAFDSLYKWGAEVGVDQFLGQLQKAIEIRDNPDLRVKTAREFLENKRQSYTVCKEFGHDVPLVISDYRGDILDPLIYGGHKLAVQYIEGIYILSTSKRSLGLENFDFTVDKVGEDILSSDLARYISPAFKLLANREEVQAALKIIRNKNELKLKVARPDIEPEKLPFYDLNSPESKTRFFGAASTDPVSLNLVDFFSVEAKLNRRVNGIHTISFKISRSGAVGRKEWMDASIKLPGRLKPDALSKIESELAQVKDVRGLMFNGRQVLILDHPVKIPKKAFEADPRRAKKLSGNVKLVAFQPYLRKPEPLYGELLIPRGDSRFGLTPIEVSYRSCETFKINQVLNRFPLTRAFDPELQKRGFPKDKDGNNALTDFNTYSFPLLKKPTAEQFNDRFFDSILVAENWPEAHWEEIMEDLEGENLRKLEFTHYEERERKEPEKAESGSSEATETHAKDGECYSGPREGISYAYPYKLFHCSKDGRDYQIIDSRNWGRALYLFCNREAAEDALKHLAGRKGKREDVANFPGFVRKIMHSGEWQNRLERAIRKEISEL